MITLCILAQGKRDDEAMHQLTDAQCGADWGQETHDHHEGCSAA
jgi:hypothetical protein